MAGDYRSGVGDAETASLGPAYYRGGDPAKPVVYEDFLARFSAAGIFRSNLTPMPRRGKLRLFRLQPTTSTRKAELQ